MVMKRMFALVVGILLSASLIGSVEASASAPPSASLKQTQQGLKNSKKVIQKMLQRDKKMREVRKAAFAKRQLAMKRK
jgi:hypothetical protein